ncbi:acyl-coenzyme A synthetase/AMP-(fatty) acid ligase [Actinopolyspora lacussalsi]|nr:acyl-coenzyme A synthetase/AMP-(fatty) acid ligase [Actinopolyspora lacussalsi]
MNDTTEITYGEWELRTNAVARGLTALGVGHGDRIGLHFSGQEWIDYAVAYLAVHKCGATAFHLNDGISAGEIDRRIEQCGAVGLLHATDISPVRGFTGWSRKVTDVADTDDSHYEHEISATDLSDILYTTGTTGTPKAIAVPHGNTTHGRGPEGFAQFRDPKPLVVPMTLGTNASATTLHIALASPTKLVLCPPGDTERFGQLAEKFRANSLMINPEIATRIVREGTARRYDLSEVATLASGAAPLSAAIARELLEDFPGATITTTFTAAEAVPAAIVGTYDPENPFSLGAPATGTEVRIADENGDTVPDGELGEIRIRCRAPQRRYLDNTTANERTYVDGWIRTGDLASIQQDGRIKFFDRASEAIHTASGLVSSVELEAAVYAYESVEDASVVSVPFGNEEVVGVGVVLGPNGSVPELRSRLREQLSDHEPPAVLERFEKLPRSQNGKVIKHSLRERLAAALRTGEGGPMSTRIESKFSVDSWDEQPLQEWEGATLTRTRMTKTFTGELEGTSEVLATMLKTPVENSMSYVAYEYIKGTMAGRSGSFVVRHSTIMTPESRSGSWTIVPNTGTGELTGITGSAEIVEGSDGTVFQLDCEFGE